MDRDVSAILASSECYPEGAGVAEWARALTGDRTVNGSSPAAVKTFRFASELWQFRLPRLASVCGLRLMIMLSHMTLYTMYLKVVC